MIFVVFQIVPIILGQFSILVYYGKADVTAYKVGVGYKEYIVP